MPTCPGSHRLLLPFVLAVLVLVGCTGCSWDELDRDAPLGAGDPASQAAPAAPAPPGSTLPAAATTATTVDRRVVPSGVVDGDTLELPDGASVRLLGVDTPERGQPLYAEATMRAQELVRGKIVTLEKEHSETDRYGRLLRHVWIDDEDGVPVCVGEVLVREGFARATPYPPDTARAGVLRAAEAEACAEHKGIWRDFVAAPYVVCSRDKFHRPDCPNAKRIGHPVRFEDRAAALESGRRPARCCYP